MSRFGLAGKITAEAGEADALEGLLLEAAAVLGENPDCELYVVARSADEPDALWVTEVWRSEEAHAASLSDERVRAVIGRARPLIAGISDQLRTRPVGGKGLG